MKSNTNFEDNDDDVDLYALLGVSPTASNREIQQAFHSSSLSFHPDRVDRDLQEDAARIFIRIKEAHDILSDSDKRALYDVVGIRAFRKGRFEVVAARCKTPAELLNEFYVEENRRLFRDSEVGLNQKTQITVTTDVSDVFKSTDGETEFNPSSVCVRDVHFSNSYDLLVPCELKSLKTTDCRFRMGSAIQIKDNMSGSFTLRPTVCFVRNLYGLNIGSVIGSGISGVEVELRDMGRMLDGKLKMLSFSGRGIMPVLQLSNSSHRLGQIGSVIFTGQASINLSYSTSSSVGYTINLIRDAVFASLGFEYFIRESVAAVNLAGGFRNENRMLFGSVSISPLSVGFRLRGEDTKQRFTRLSADLTVAIDRVVLSLGFSRGSVSYRLPLVLSAEPSLGPVYYSIAIAGIAYWVSKKLSKEIDEKPNCSGSKKTREDALREQTIMNASFLRAVEKERSSPGFGCVVIAAEYGGGDDASFDVTIPVQLLVSAGGDGARRVRLPRFYPLEKLKGFYRPAPECVLRVEYERGGRRVKVEFAEADEIRIPCF